MGSRRRSTSQSALGNGTKALCAVYFFLLITSCGPPQAIATFAGIAQQAIEKGPPLFTDLYGTCTRTRLDRQPIEPIFKGKIALEAKPDQPDNGTCSELQTEAQALSIDSATVSTYFNTIHQLAAFNTSVVTGPTTNAATQAATTANLTASQVEAIGKLAGLATEAVMGHYQKSRLIRYVQDADASVSDAAQAFEKVAHDYEGMLDEERRTLRARYQDAGGTDATAVVLLLNHAYEQDLSELEQRKASADAYIKALDQIAKGHHELAQQANKLNGKKLGLALEPYSASLQQLVPQIQKAFP